MPRKRRTPQDAAASASAGKGGAGVPQVSQLEEQLVGLHVGNAPQTSAPFRVAVAPQTSAPPRVAVPSAAPQTSAPPRVAVPSPAPQTSAPPRVAVPSPAPQTSAPPRVAVPSSVPQTSAPQPVPTRPVATPAATLAAVPAAAPASSKLLRFPLRPGLGSAGRKCSVKANHFLVKLPQGDLYQYDVTISPEVQSRGVNRAIIDELVKLYRASHLGGRLPAYDGRKSLYTAGALPSDSVEFNINLVDEHETRRRQRTFKVKIKHAARISMSHLKSFLAGKQADVPQEALQAFDIVLREFPTRRYAPVGRSFFSYFLGRQPLGGALESWRGFYQSIRPAQMGLSLNVDLSATAFIQPLSVVEFVSKTLGKQLDRVFSDSDRTRVKKLLRGVKVEVTHRGTAKRRYRISGLTSQPTRDLTFPVEDGTVQTVMKYFEEKYGYTMQYPFLPCLEVGSLQRLNYLPMEVCKIVEGQRYPKRLDDGQVSELRKVTCQRPPARESYILKCVQENAYQKDSFAREFGISISENISLVEARVLPPPKLKYHDSGRERDCTPRIGKWNMMNKKMVNGAAIKYWTCVNFARLNLDVVSAFCGSLARMCQTSGMAFNDQSVLPVSNARPEQVESILPQLYGRAQQQTSGQHLQLLIVVLPDNNGPLYGDVKRICETRIGIVSQCCLQKNVWKMNSQYFANVALKINAKLGGRNTVLDDALSRRIPLVSDKPTIIFGADVTHPQPGEDSSPSIAAVVASLDWPEITKYAGVVRAQSHRKEMIEHLYETWTHPTKGTLEHGGMIRELLMCFYTSTRQKPSRIIFYRDGVSEGQFSQVLQYELDAIHKACASLEANYRPPVTFVVVQKRHHTRLFPSNYNDKSLMDKSDNVLPGTVVDTKICHPAEFDFYLCSHAGIQGTSRPAHYHVLWDENKFTADLLQTFTNNLCYTYARSTSSVSIVPPAYYAHLAAFRARFYMPNDASDSGSVTTGSGTRAAGHAIRDLPPVKENLKSFMFYC